MIKKIVIAVVILGLVALGYFWLGGGKQLAFKMEERPTSYVIGYDFKGAYNSSDLEEIFFKVKEESEKTGADLVIINYDDDSLSKNTIHQLVGFISNSQNDLEENQSVVVLESGKYLSTLISAHNLVMPKPNKVREQAEEFSAELGLIPEKISIEIYKGERELQIMFPLKAK